MKIRIITALVLAAFTFMSCSKGGNSPSSIKFTQSVYQMEAGTTLEIKVYFVPAGTSGTVSWTSDTPAVATVDNNGTVTALKAGSATITASCASLSCKCTINVSGDVPDDKTAFTMRLMQFNVLQATSETAGHEWATVRKQPCFKMMEETAPDIVCCEEARKSQCNDFASKFPSYAQVKHPKDNIESNGGQRNLIMYRSDRFEVLDWNKYWFSVDESPSGDRFCPAGVTNSTSKTTQKLTVCVHFREKTSGCDFYVFCTHFFASVDAESQREKCVELSLAHIKAIGADTPVFFCGDLNINYSDENGKALLKPMLGYMQSASLGAITHDSPTATTYNKFGASTKTLDYIFYRNASAVTYKVVNGTGYGTQYISDHYPIYADIKVARKE